MPKRMKQQGKKVPKAVEMLAVVRAMSARRPTSLERAGAVKHTWSRRSQCNVPKAHAGSDPKEQFG